MRVPPRTSRVDIRPGAGSTGIDTNAPAFHSARMRRRHSLNETFWDLLPESAGSNQEGAADFGDPASGSRMALAMRVQELVQVEVRIFLRGRQALMAKHFLNGPQVRPAPEQM